MKKIISMISILANCALNVIAQNLVIERQGHFSAAISFSAFATAQTAESFKQPYPLGSKLSPNPNFTGDVWLSAVTKEKELNVPMANVTFAPGCRNSWHSHTGGQILIATAGIGYYQERGKTVRCLFPGDIVEIAPGVEHWHGSAPDSWFAHIAISCNPNINKPTWLQPVTDEEYATAVNTSTSVYDNQALSAREQAIVAIASYTGKGDLEHLPLALTEGLKSGMTVNEIKEILIQAYAYCGFPRSLRAIQAFMKVLDERKTQGINDTMGKEAISAKQEDNKYDRGAAILQVLSGINSAHPKSGYGAFAPAIDQFLKEHLFADIFERGLLSYRERELATVSFLAGIGGVEPMAAGHISICLHLGITKEQLTALLNIVEINLGKQSSEPLRKVLKSVSK